MPEAAVNGQRIAHDITGSGPPLLLLHGFPQTRAMWAPLVPHLAGQFTVITADLRGYGDSSKPQGTEAMRFRAMGADMLALMRALGHERFYLAGHDRGARVAHRMALDAPEAVARLSVMDIVPTAHLLRLMTAPIAQAYYHWFFLAQPSPFPERMIAADPDAFFTRCLLGFGKAELSQFAPAQLDHYRKAWRNPACIHAMCCDYRAAIELDQHDDLADAAAGRRVICPMQVLYGRDGAMARLLDVPATWAGLGTDITAQAMPGGHFFPDQHPQDTARALLAFMAG